MPNSQPKKIKRYRSCTGCLPCRKRKMKCDEGKPECANCMRSAYICEWTTERQTVKSLSTFVIKKYKSKKTRFIDVSKNYIKCSNDCEESKLKFNKRSETLNIHTEDDLVQIEKSHRKENQLLVIQQSSIIPKDTSITILKQNYEDALFRKYLQHLGEQYILSFNFISNRFPSLGLYMNKEELELFDAFTNGFMVAITPQLAHEKLQPSAIVIPRGINNAALRSVFYACGATYMSWNNKELRAYAETQYQNCLKAIQNLIDSKAIAGNEDWILISMVTFCLREKYQCQDSVRNALFLIASLEIIKYWTKAKTKSKSVSKNSGTFTDDNEFSEYMDQFELQTKLHEICIYLSKRNFLSSTRDVEHIFTSLKMTRNVENTDLKLETKDDLLTELVNVYYDILPFERTMIESFLFNYSVNLLNFNSTLLEYLDSPFLVFKNLSPLLTKPIYNCPVKWMNNPIMGASLPAFELAAKANWLRLHYPLNNTNKLIASKLRSLAKFYTSPFLPEAVKFKEPTGVQRKLMESCYVGNMTAMASFILLTKILFPDYTSYNEEIQDSIQIYFKNLRKLSPHSQAGAMCMWSFIITGLAITEKHQFDYLIYRIRTFGEMKKSEALLRVLLFLQSAWEFSEQRGITWDIMLLKEGFKDLFI